MVGTQGTERSFPTLGGAAVESAFSFPDAVSFLDKLLAALDEGVQSDRKAFPAGWISLRVTGRTTARLGMQRFDRNGTIEVVLFGRPDGYGIVKMIEDLALREGAALHWGESNGLVRVIDLEKAYGKQALEAWKDDQRMLGGDTFTNLFMRRSGLS